MKQKTENKNQEKECDNCEYCVVFSNLFYKEKICKNKEGNQKENGSECPVFTFK